MRKALKRLIITGLCLAAAACQRGIYIQNRSSGESGHATVSVMIGHPSGDITVTIGSKTYTGRWVYVSGGGTMTFASVFSPKGGVVSGTAIGLPMQGNGSIIASSPDGSSLRCLFTYSSLSSSGLGGCQDSNGTVYDLQIN